MRYAQIWSPNLELSTVMSQLSTHQSDCRYCMPKRPSCPEQQIRPLCPLPIFEHASFVAIYEVRQHTPYVGIVMCIGNSLYGVTMTCTWCQRHHICPKGGDGQTDISIYGHKMVMMVHTAANQQQFEPTTSQHTIIHLHIWRLLRTASPLFNHIFIWLFLTNVHDNNIMYHKPTSYIYLYGDIIFMSLWPPYKEFRVHIMTNGGCIGNSYLGWMPGFVIMCTGNSLYGCKSKIWNKSISLWNVVE